VDLILASLKDSHEDFERRHGGKAQGVDQNDVLKIAAKGARKPPFAHFDILGVCTSSSSSLSASPSSLS
jgi:hypothetical protein